MADEIEKRLNLNLARVFMPLETINEEKRKFENESIWLCCQTKRKRFKSATYSTYFPVMNISVLYDSKIYAAENAFANCKTDRRNQAARIRCPSMDCHAFESRRINFGSGKMKAGHRWRCSNGCCPTYYTIVWICRVWYIRNELGFGAAMRFLSDQPRIGLDQRHSKCLQALYDKESHSSATKSKRLRLVKKRTGHSLAQPRPSRAEICTGQAWQGFLKIGL